MVKPEMKPNEVRKILNTLSQIEDIRELEKRANAIIKENNEKYTNNLNMIAADLQYTWEQFTFCCSEYQEMLHHALQKLMNNKLISEEEDKIISEKLELVMTEFLKTGERICGEDANSSEVSGG